MYYNHNIIDIEYFPQNDWINFMKWPETIDKFEGKDQEIVKHLCQFIKEVRNYYNITDDKLDFGNFVLVMKQEFEIFTKLSEQIKEKP